MRHPADVHCTVSYKVLPAGHIDPRPLLLTRSLKEDESTDDTPDTPGSTVSNDVMSAAAANKAVVIFIRGSI